MIQRWSSALFPIILLSALAALTFWLEQATHVSLRQDDGKARHDPDSIVERFTLRRLSPEGSLQYKLVSPKMIHFADDDTSQITTPHLTYYRPGTPDFTIRSERALVTKGGDMVRMEENVIAARAPSKTRPGMIATMPDLTIRPNEGKAYTASPVEITQGASWMKGIGMEMDNNTQVFKLLSRVSGLYLSPTKP